MWRIVLLLLKMILGILSVQGLVRVLSNLKAGDAADELPERAKVQSK